VGVIGRIEKLNEETRQLTVCFGKSAVHLFVASEDSDTRVDVSEGVVMPIANQDGNDSHFTPENFGKERQVKAIAPASKRNLKAPDGRY
jgi:hypothetical protein